MTSANGLQPFDRHPADAGALSNSAQSLAEQAAQAIDTSQVTVGAFAPAPLNWEGMAAPELRAAPQPVRQTALAISESLSWASVAVQYWSMKVRAFNDRVEEIRAGLATGRSRISAATDPSGDPISNADKANALQVLEAEARKLWWLAYNADIVAGAQTAAGMLRDGPTSINVAAAVMVGLLPFGQPWNPLGPISRTFQTAGFSPFDIPFPLVPIDGCPLDDEFQNNIINGAMDGMTAGSALGLPFKEAMAQMLGDAVGDAGVDAINEDTGVCVTPVDLPQPPDPPKPQPEPSAVDDVLDWLGNAGEDADAWVDQAVEDVGYEIEHPPPIWPGPPPSLEPE
jgi:hypothetical protein